MEDILAALTASDRCDRCGAQALSYVETPGGGELLFCLHHAKEHLPALEALGARVLMKDEQELVGAPA